jgi:hypothetical protein
LAQRHALDRNQRKIRTVPKQAVQVNIGIMRAFVRLREALATNAELAEMVKRHDREIGVLFEHVEQLLRLPEPREKSIGFSSEGTRVVIRGRYSG